MAAPIVEQGTTVSLQVKYDNYDYDYDIQEEELAKIMNNLRLVMRANFAAASILLSISKAGKDATYENADTSLLCKSIHAGVSFHKEALTQDSARVKDELAKRKYQFFDGDRKINENVRQVVLATFKGGHNSLSVVPPIINGDWILV